MGGVNLPPMNMNKPQRDVILTGLIVVAVMALFPPWIDSRGNTDGYHIIIYAPDWDSTINLARLGVQILLVVAACAAVLLYLRRDS